MDTIQSVLPAEGLPETRKAALVNLLGDEDPAVYQAVREKILSFGDTSRQWLRPHMLSSDPLIRRRAQDIVRHFEGLAADNRFLAFCLVIAGAALMPAPLRATPDAASTPSRATSQRDPA